MIDQEIYQQLDPVEQLIVRKVTEISKKKRQSTKLRELDHAHKK